MNCNCQGPQSDFTLLKDVLDRYAKEPGSLITILQKANPHNRLFFCFFPQVRKQILHRGIKSLILSTDSIPHSPPAVNPSESKKCADFSKKTEYRR